MNGRRRLLATFLAVWAAGLALCLPASPARADRPVVRALLFYLPSCGHCHEVMTNALPPLVERYGDQLVIVAVNIDQPEGGQLYTAAIEMFAVPPERRGVPLLVVGDVTLVGSVEIPERFPALVEQYLAEGGIDWPAIPGLEQVLPVTATPPPATATPAGATVTPAGAAPTALPQPADTGMAGLIVPDERPVSVAERFSRDLAGNTLAVVVLCGMILVVGYRAATFRPAAARPVAGRPAAAGTARRRAAVGWRAWAIPALALFGFVVAGYLAYVETAQVRAVCGPVGDCNTVQQSEYARLFGILPIGVLGMAGYVAVISAWLAGYYGRGHVADLAWLALLAGTFGGTLFSIYLTFLEPFVIGATCAWCLTSSVVMTALFWLAVPPAERALAHLIGRKEK